MARRRKQRDQWGSISEIEKGKRYRIRYWSETESGYRRVSRTVRGTRRDAEEERAKLLLEHGRDRPCPTVGFVWSRYVMPEFEQRVSSDELSPRSLIGYRRSWEADVSPVWSDVPCDQVRPLAIQQWLSSIGLSQAKRGLQMLNKALDYAVRYEFIERNPAREKYLMPSKGTVRRRDTGVWTLPELEEVWHAVAENAAWMEPAFLIAAFGGARVSESVGPLAGEIGTFESGGVMVATIPIARQVTKENGVTDRLKTESSRRVTAIAGKAGARLHALASALSPDCPLTNDGMGGFTNRDRLNHSWRLDVLPNLPESLRHPFQNTRNSYQTNCRWTLDMQPWVIEALMGHRREGVTGMHYDRPQAEMFAKSVADSYARSRYDADWKFPDWD